MTSSAAFAGAFYTSFQAQKSTIESLSTSTITEDHAQCVAALADLRQSLTAATVFLPAYDRRQLEEQWKSLEKIVTANVQGTSTTPKPKFSFAKRNKSSGTTPSPTTTGASTPIQDITQPPSSNPPSSSSQANPSTTHNLNHLTNSYITTNSISHNTSSISLTLSSLSSCIVDLLPSPGTPATMVLTALYAENVEKCVILVPRDLAGSVMLSNLKGCVVIAGCQQFRIHDSQDCTILLDIPSHPIIERCQGMRFGGYPEGLGDDVVNGTADPRRQSKHKEVQDFDWVRPGASPNWKGIDPASCNEWIIALRTAREQKRCEGGDDDALQKLLTLFGVAMR